MEYMSENDFFYVNKASVLTGFDREILVDLYQPIIGSVATSLFFTLWTESGYSNKVGSIGSLLNIMQINTSQLLDARRHLEGIGLLKTYLKKNEESQYFSFVLYAPKQPNDFFNDEIFTLLLERNSTSKERVESLKAKYLDSSKEYIKQCKKDGFEEITSHFKDVYSPDIYSVKYEPSKIRNNAKKRRTASIVLDFDLGVFFKTIKDIAMINEEFFSSEEVETIKRVALVYGIPEASMAEILVNKLDQSLPKGARVDFDGLVKDLNKWNLKDYIKKPKAKDTPDTENLNKLIKIMEETNPVKFLMYRQNGSNVAQSDANLLNRLSSEFGLPNGVINALISYVLEVKNNTLPSSYTEKIAGSLAREGVANSYDAMNYLNKTHKKMSKKVSENKSQEQEDEYDTPSYDLSSLDE